MAISAVTDSAAPEAIEALERASYMSFETYKRDGQPVRLPVWVFRHGGRLTVWTDASSYKVARVRRNPSFRAAPCNASGSTILGSWVDGKATVIEDPAVVAAAEQDLRAKYGWQVSLIRFVNRVRRKRGPYVLVVLDV